MLRIRKLNIEDFKSFRTLNIKFKDGLTAVVGPNGCGKSNLFDAILFVLGNTASKKLRYTTIEDLINKDSENKIAKVSISLENSEKKEEYKISREVSEKGSVFRLNGSRTTLEAITNLLGNYNIYSDGHNFILQDKIKKITDATDLERKKIIDEIAGIEKFEDTLKSTKDNLNKVEEKLEKIMLVLNEKEDWLKSLKSQKDAAEKFIEYNNKKTTIKAVIFRKQKEHTEKEITKLDEKISTTTKEITELTKELENTKTDRENFDTKLKEFVKEVEKQTTKYEHYKEEFTKKELILQNDARNENKVDREKKYLEADIQTKTKDIEKTNKKIEELDQRISEIAEELRNSESTIIETKQFSTFTYDTQLEKIEREVSALQAKIAELEKNHPDALEKIKETDDLREKIKSLEQEIKIVEVEKNTISNNYTEEENVIYIKDETEIPQLLEDLVSENKYGTFVFALENSEFEDCQIENTKRSGPIYITTLSPTEQLNTLDSKSDELNRTIVGFTKELEIKESQKEDFLNKINNEREIKKGRLLEQLSKRISERKTVLSEVEKIRTEVNKIKLQQKNAEIINNKKIEIEKIKEEIKYKSELILFYKNEIKSIEKNIEQKNAELYKLKEKINLDTLEIVQDKVNLSIEHKTLEDQIQEKNNLQNKLTLASQKIMDLKNSTTLKQSQSEQAKRDLTQKRNELVEINEEINAFVKINTGFIIDLESKDTNKAVHILKIEITELEDNIIKLGPVNHKAIEDYNRLFEEVGEIENKTKKLSEEKEKVLELLNKINLEKTTAFMENFSAIKEKFEKNVVEIGLGTGELAITDKDLDKAGIKITIKQKRNKKSLQSLSGGEKSLVSVAFILAILEHKPASFYLLDEIDAALDYQNTDKIVKLLKTLSKETQIFVISHNTETIKLCDYVLGITKNTRGTSIIGVTKELIS